MYIVYPSIYFVLQCLSVRFYNYLHRVIAHLSVDLFLSILYFYAITDVIYLKIFFIFHLLLVHRNMIDFLCVDFTLAAMLLTY